MTGQKISTRRAHSKTLKTAARARTGSVRESSHFLRDFVKAKFTACAQHDTIHWENYSKLYLKTKNLWHVKPVLVVLVCNHHPHYQILLCLLSGQNQVRVRSNNKLLKRRVIAVVNSLTSLIVYSQSITGQFINCL